MLFLKEVELNKNVPIDFILIRAVAEPHPSEAVVWSIGYIGYPCPGSGAKFDAYTSWDVSV